MPTEPGRDTFDLPFMMPLEPGSYELIIKGERVGVEHEFVRQEHLDPRLGIAGGQFGLQRDQLGLVRYSKVGFQLEEAQVARLARALFGGLEHLPELSPDNIRVRVAAAVCNHFVDVFRATLDEPDVHRVGDGDLMLFRYQLGHRRTTLRAYGGTPRLEVIGLQPAAHERLLDAFSNGREPPAWDLAALDASRAIRDGRVGDGIVGACTALESALDVDFARVWRRTRTPTAAAIVDIGLRPDNRLRTIDDVLAEAGVRRKFERYAVRENLSQDQQDTMSNAIDLRNLVIHVGAQLEPERYSLTARRAIEFIRGDLKRVVEAQAQPRSADLVCGYEEAVGGRCPPCVARVVHDLVTACGLQARLHNRHARRGEMVTNEVGNLLVVYISFGSFSQDDIDLFIARAAMNHWLRYDAAMPAAHVSDDLPFEENRPFFGAVARELTYRLGCRPRSAPPPQWLFDCDPDEPAAACRRTDYLLCTGHLRCPSVAGVTTARRVHSARSGGSWSADSRSTTADQGRQARQQGNSGES
jgi:hypothetical protein